jgi:PAS domain S-box-containing protein
VSRLGADAESEAANAAGWASLFWEAFKRSRNGMVLLDSSRRYVDVNGAYIQLLGYSRQELIGRPFHEHTARVPLLTAAQWREAMKRRQLAGVVDLVCADGRIVTVQFAGHPEVVTGAQLVLFVVLRSGRGTRQREVQAAAVTSVAGLSRREREVVHLIALGSSGPEIADELQVTHNTVRTHVRNAMVKLGARSRAQLVAMSLGDGQALN